MRAKKFLGVAGAGAAVGAALIVPASVADAGTTYNSTATATPGSLSIGGKSVPITVGPATATNGHPADKSQSLKTIVGTISSLNSQAGSSVANEIPANADLIAETATASPDGTSAACSAVVAAGCVGGQPQPVMFNTSGAGAGTGQPSASGDSRTFLFGLFAVPAPVSRSSISLPSSLPTSEAGLGRSVLSGVSGVTGQNAQTDQGASGASSPAASSSSSSGTSAANALAGYSGKAVVYGPAAACTAGPAGKSGSGFSASSTPGSIILTLYKNGQPLGPPVTLKPGDVLSQLHLDSTLRNLEGSNANRNINLTVTKGSVSPNGPETSATGGEMTLTTQGKTALDAKGGKVTCGPNKAAATTASATTSAPQGNPGSSGTGTTTSAETPLGGGIQTDEGRSASGSDGGAWAAAAAAGVLGGTASGIGLWLRRRRIS